MPGQTIAVQVVEALGAYELVAIAESVQTDDALATGQIAAGQMFADNIDQIKDDRQALRFLDLGIAGAAYSLQSGIIEAARTQQLEIGTYIRIARRW